jgi:hypothetical protein
MAMAMATMADLSSVGISLDHIACTAVPFSYPNMGITLIIAVSGAVCPLNAESHRRRSQGLDFRFPQPAVVSLTACTAVALVFPVFLCGQAQTSSGRDLLTVEIYASASW